MKEKIYKLKYGSIHNKLEHLLLDTVSLLKDSNSDGGFSNILERVQEIIKKLNNEQIKDDLQKSCKLLQEGIDNHDIAKFFEAHEIIHDYDYWVANSPLSLSYPAADWGGINVYFGKVSIM